MAAGNSPRQQRKLDALARKTPALMDEVRAGRKSTHRACVEAGIVKVKTAPEKAYHWWRRSTGHVSAPPPGRAGVL